MLSRRDWLKLSAAGVSAVSLSGWLQVLASRAAETRAKHKSCILLWMDGGPSHKDTFDMKPGTKDGGEFKPISTAVPGIQISEHFPKFAKVMKHAAILRGMSTDEGAHPRAKYYLHTGYKEGQGGLTYPSLGSLVSAEIGKPNAPMPNYVSIGARSYGPGFLGARHAPLIVNDPARGVENLKPMVGGSHFDDRLGMLQEMESAFYREYKAEASADHKTREPASSRQAYGSSRFGDGCLLARRLVETGVSFVEVTLGGWDTHQNNFERVKQLSQQCDPAIAALVSDLKQRGLLDSTLIVWMGEFGRTPRINQRGAKPGRDHYPRAWSTVMIGGGIKGGQVIGKTDPEGANVVEGKVSALDFLATVCEVLGVNWKKQNNTPIGRPIRIVDKGANLIKGLL